MKIPRYVFGLIGAAVIAGVLVYAYRYGMVPSFYTIQEQRLAIEAFLMRDPFLGVGLFALAYVLVTAFSIPLATPLTILSGFLFGSVLGTSIVVVSATIGATIIFILARFFFRGFFTRTFGDKLEVVNNELTNHGFSDVLFLRLAPVVPFSLINVVAALTSVSTRNYVLGTLIGIIPFTFVYAHAGAELARIEHPSDILSFETVLGISAIVIVLGLLFVIHRHRAQSRRK